MKKRTVVALTTAVVTASIRAAISSRPMAHWFTGTGDVACYAGSSGKKLSALVAYNLPGRDACGSQSAGGAAGVTAYQKVGLCFCRGDRAEPLDLPRRRGRAASLRRRRFVQPILAQHLIAGV